MSARPEQSATMTSTVSMVSAGQRGIRFASAAIASPCAS